MSTSIQHLHIVQCAIGQLSATLDKLQAVYQQQDHIILMEDAIFALYDARITTFHQISVLNSDQNLVSPCLNDLKIQVIDYPQLAEYIAQADKVLTWR